MKSFRPQLKLSRPGQQSLGSILIYVLWILVVISTLAFHLASGSRATTLSQSAFAKQLKTEMQLQSAIQFSIYKITSNQWQDEIFELNLNSQQINISIWNESGFVSIYQPGEILNRIYESIDLPEATIESMSEAFGDINMPLRLNSIYELKQFSEIDEDLIAQLIPLVSIYREETINPLSSPAAVLKFIPGIDLYRVRKLSETDDAEEKLTLRTELVDLLSGRNFQLSDHQDGYFRVNINIAQRLYQVFLKYDRRQKKYKVVTIEVDSLKTLQQQSL